MIVIDASVAVKIINRSEEDVSQAENLYNNHVTGKEQIIVPELLFIEVANYLATKTLTSSRDIRNGLAILINASFITEPINPDLLLESTQLAKKHGTSVYDMLYAVIAKNKKIKLITADDRFVKKVGFSFVQTLAHYA